MPIAQNTVALWNLDNALTDSSGNAYTLSQTGAVPFVTSPTPAQGAYAAGAFGAAQYLSTPAGFNTAFAGLAAWTVEGYFYANSIANGPALVSVAYAGALQYQLIRILSTGAVRIINNDASFADSSAGLVTTGAWYYFFIRYNGTALTAGVSPAASPDATSDVSLTTTATTNAASTTYLGRHGVNGLELPLNGYLDGVRASNVYRGTLPTTDVSGSAISPTFIRRRRRG